MSIGSDHSNNSLSTVAYKLCFTRIYCNWNVMCFTLRSRVGLLTCVCRSLVLYISPNNLGHSSLVLINQIITVDKHIGFALTGAGRSAESCEYLEVGAVAVQLQQDRKNEEPLYESVDGEAAL